SSGVKGKGVEKEGPAGATRVGTGAEVEVLRAAPVPANPVKKAPAKGKGKAPAQPVAQTKQITESPAPRAKDSASETLATRVKARPRAPPKEIPPSEASASEQEMKATKRKRRASSAPKQGSRSSKTPAQSREASKPAPKRRKKASPAESEPEPEPEPERKPKQRKKRHEDEDEERAASTDGEGDEDDDEEGEADGDEPRLPWWIKTHTDILNWIGPCNMCSKGKAQKDMQAQWDVAMSHQATMWETVRQTMDRLESAGPIPPTQRALVSIGMQTAASLPENVGVKTDTVMAEARPSVEEPSTEDSHAQELRAQESGVQGSRAQESSVQESGVQES
ncbi:hypothetical protein OF83DRAFT_1179188, partial [Amylostereum chailletii]